MAASTTQLNCSSTLGTVLGLLDGWEAHVGDSTLLCLEVKHAFDAARRLPSDAAPWLQKTLSTR